MADSVKFQPISREGIAGLPASKPQIVSFVGGIAGLIGGLSSSHPIFALSALGIGFAGAIIPAGELRVVEWVPNLMRFASRQVSGRYRYLDDGKFPAPLSDTAILAWEMNEQTIAVIRRGKTYTIVLECTSRSPALIDDDEIAADVESWANLQRQISLPSNHIARLTWTETAGPADPLGAVRWFEKNVAVPQDHAFAEEYREAIGDTSGAIRHIIHLTVQMDVRRKATERAVKASGGGDLGACRVLDRTVEWLVAELRATRRESRILDPNELRIACRKRFDPDLAPGLAMIGKTANWNPSGAIDGNRTYLSDGSHHITGKVIRLPEHLVQSDFLWPLLMSSQHYRTVACVIDTWDPRKAIRLTERNVVTSNTVGELRQRYGFIPSLRTEKKDASAAVREEEIDQGHRVVDIAMYVSVTSGSGVLCICGENEAGKKRKHPKLDPECPAWHDAEQAYADIETDAALSHIDLQRRFSNQEQSFLCTLPLGRRT